MVREISIKILAYCTGDNEISLEYDKLLKVQVINMRSITILVMLIGHYVDIYMIMEKAIIRSFTIFLQILNDFLKLMQNFTCDCYKTSVL